MTEPRSLTVDKSLIERLQPLICCSESMATCRDDEFCASDPKEWPVVPMWPNFQIWADTDSSEKTRLIYPEDEGRQSLPDTAKFCGAYMSWYTQTGCGALAKDIVNRLGSANHCSISSNPDKLINQVLKHTYRKRRPGVEKMMQDGLAKYIEPYELQCDQMAADMHDIHMAMLARCAIMYDKSDAGQKFNPERAGDLHNIATFCQWVQETGQKQGPGQDGFSWTTFFQGGGAVAILGTVWLLLRKIIKGIGKAGDQVTEAGTRLDKLTKGLRHLSYISIPNFIKMVGYFCSFKWVKGKKPPKLRTEQDTTGPKVKDQQAVPTKQTKWAKPGTDPGFAPNANVVRTQLASLADSDNPQYAKWGQRFNKLSRTAQEYMSHLAVRKWFDKAPGYRERLLTEDTGWSEGMLPRGFLTDDFARSYLISDEELKFREASAEAWATKHGKTIPKSVANESQFKPRRIIVVGQLTRDHRYIKLESDVQNYLAKKAIAEWRHHYSAKVRQTFVGPEDEPDKGTLPQRFIETFLEDELKDPEATRRHALAFAKMIKRLPKLDAYPFELLDNRAGVLLSHWENVPEEIRKEFRLMDGLAPYAKDPYEITESFVAYMEPLLTIVTETRKPLDPLPEAWDFSTMTNLSYKGFDLRLIMSDLSEINPELPKYPEILMLRVHSIVDGWLAVPNEQIQTGFINEDIKNGEDIGREVPKSFVIFRYGPIGLGKGSRPAVATSVKLPSVKDEPGEDDPEDRGGGKGGTPAPSGPADVGSGSPTGQTPPASKARSTSSEEHPIRVGGFCSHVPVLFEEEETALPLEILGAEVGYLEEGADIMTGTETQVMGITPEMMMTVPAGMGR